MAGFKQGLQAAMSGFTQGLEAAAKYLEGTAADYEEMVKRGRANPRGTERERTELKIWEEKAQLLRGQVMHIRGLKPPPKG